MFDSKRAGRGTFRGANDFLYNSPVKAEEADRDTIRGDQNRGNFSKKEKEEEKETCWYSWITRWQLIYTEIDSLIYCCDLLFNNQ